MFTESIFWLFGAYLAGSVATYFLMIKSTVLDASERTLDMLIDGGFLKVRKNSDGEIEILKWDSND